MTSLRFGQWALRFLTAAGGVGVVCSCDLGAESVDRGSPGSSSAGTPTTCAQPPPAPEATNPYPCLNPTPFANAESGLERCDNGVLHRFAAGSCEVASADAERYGCLVDSDCSPASICLCDEAGVGACASATCSSDEDCAEGFSCLGRGYVCLGYWLQFACQTPADECGSNAECPCDADHDQCVWEKPLVADETPVRRCHRCGTGGRPFLVEASPRTARTEASSAWQDPSLQPLACVLPAGLRARLSAHWQQQAEMEHASVAAFARFVLELLSLGAPPDLVSAATDALGDETAHARLCYALASSYAGQALGPGKLNVVGALDDLTLDGIVTRAVLEGCVGETLAAIEVSEAASHVVDEGLRAVLSRIAEDEARHAELSWCFLRWALAKGGTTLRQTVQRTFREAESQLRERAALHVPSEPWDGPLLAQGVLSPGHRARLASQTFAEVIRPCERALRLESPGVVASAPAAWASQEPLNG